MTSLTDTTGAPDGPLIYLVVGEPSGDQLGVNLMKGLKALTGGRVRFAGLAGERMTAEGLESLFPIDELAVMGLEIVPRLRHLLRLIRRVADDIVETRPDAVVMIDAQGFAVRVGEKIMGQGIPIVQYVAPTVWAWRPGRAKHIARYLDRLLTIFPFEGPYFEPLGLETTYVGHSAAEARYVTGDGPGFRARHDIPADARVLCVLPGSRRGEVKRLLAVYGETLKLLAEDMPDLVCVVPTVSTVAERVEEATAGWPFRTIVLRGAVEKYDAFAAADLALATSGTVTVETAFADLPTIVVYRAPAVSAFVGRLILKVKYAAAVNLVLDREVLPEFIQENCTAPNLADAVRTLMFDEGARAEQRAGMAEAKALFCAGDDLPSRNAARAILDEMERYPHGRRAVSAKEE